MWPFVISSLLIFNILQVHTFEEYSIFEDDDIYGNVVSDSPNTEQTEIAAIVPGTKWCGPGDIAKNFSDLGTYRETDICCREHDTCNDLILPKKSKHGLQNPDMFTRLQCDCEQKFINCLKKSNDLIAWSMGKVYYNARSICYRNDYPIVKCIEHQTGLITRRKRCIKYNLDNTKSKQWQWFDMPFFTQ